MMHWQVQTWLSAVTVEKCAYHTEYVQIVVILKAGKLLKLKKKRSNIKRAVKSTARKFLYELK
jgi:hypothetical protein